LLRPEESIRDVALKSAIWTRQTWIAVVLRQMASAGDSVALKWLAITTTGGEDGALIVAQSKLLESPQSRCDLLVRFSHPGVLEVLRGWVASDDTLLATIAGEAFTRITAFDVRGERIQAPVSDTADDFDHEFAPLIWTTDISKINNYLRQNSTLLKSANRWSRGLPLDVAVSADTLAAIDLQMRWDQLARNRLAGNLSYQPEPIIF
jgi:hypothetical protein